jgi:excisionase family DNA binding protein
MTPEPLLTARQVAELLGFAPGTIVDWYEAGKLPGFKLGGRLRFRPSEVEAWLEAKRAGAGGEAPATPRQRPPEGVVSLAPATPK